MIPAGLPGDIARDLVAGYVASGLSSETIMVVLRTAQAAVMAQISTEMVAATAERDAAAARVAALEALLAGAVTSQAAPGPVAPAAAAAPPSLVDQEEVRRLVARALVSPRALSANGILAKEIAEIIGHRIADVSSALGWLSRMGQAKTVQGTKRWNAVAPPLGAVDPVATAAAAAAQDDENAEPDHEDHDDFVAPDEPDHEDHGFLANLPRPCVHRWTEPGKQSLSNICLDCGARHGTGDNVCTVPHQWGSNGVALLPQSALAPGDICLRCSITYGDALAASKTGGAA